MKDRNMKGYSGEQIDNRRLLKKVFGVLKYNYADPLNMFRIYYKRRIKRLIFTNLL